jgi:hypothetical protein
MRRLLRWGIPLVVALLLGPRLLAPVASPTITCSVYRLLSSVGVDDELPSLAFGVNRLLFWPFEGAAAERLFDLITHEPGTVNDLLVFSAASETSRSLSVERAERLFFETIGPLRAAPCERRYLLAAVLPLAQRGHLLTQGLRLTSVWDAYNLVGYKGNGGATDCAALTRALELCTSGQIPISFSGR